MSDRKRRHSAPMVIGHRGVPSLAPENTLAGIEQAVDLRLDCVELDVRTTKDGKLVVLHDATVDRTTNGMGPVANYTYEELQTLDAGSWYAARFSDQRIPLLDSALECMAGRTFAYIDVKDARIALVYDALNRYGMLSNSVVYAGFGQLLTARIQFNADNLLPEVGTSYARLAWMRRVLKPKAVAVSKGGLTQGFVDLCHSGGVMVFVDALGDLGKPASLQAMLDMGADGIQTARPELLVEIIGRQKEKASGEERRDAD